MRASRSNPWQQPLQEGMCGELCPDKDVYCTRMAGHDTLNTWRGLEHVARWRHPVTGHWQPSVTWPVWTGPAS